MEGHPLTRIIVIDLQELRRRDPGVDPTGGSSIRASTMAEHMKIVAPREDTPLAGYSGRTITGRLPDDLVSEQIRRLAAFSAVVGGLWTFGLAMDSIIVPLTLAVHEKAAGHRDRSGRDRRLRADVSLRSPRSGTNRTPS